LREPRGGDPERSIELQLLDRVHVTRWKEQLRLQLQCAGKCRLALHHEAQYVFDPTLRHDDVETDRAAVLSLGLDDASIGDEGRLPELRPYWLQPDVPVGAIDHGGKARRQGDRLIDIVEAEFG